MVWLSVRQRLQSAPKIADSESSGSAASETFHRAPTITDEVALEAARVKSMARDSVSLEIEIDVSEFDGELGDDDIEEVRPPPPGS